MSSPSHINDSRLDNDHKVLQFALQVFSKKIRPCNLAHENIQRDEDNNPKLLQVRGKPDVFRLNYVDECRVQHFGCPHYLHNTIVPTLQKIRSLISMDTELKCLETLEKSQMDIDSIVCNARTNHKITDVISYPTLDDQLAALPSLEAGKRAAAPHIAIFNSNCAELNTLRLQIVEKIQTALLEMKNK